MVEGSPLNPRSGHAPNPVLISLHCRAPAFWGPGGWILPAGFLWRRWGRLQRATRSTPAATACEHDPGRRRRPFFLAEQPYGQNRDQGHLHLGGFGPQRCGWVELYAGRTHHPQHRTAVSGLHYGRHHAQCGWRCPVLLRPSLRLGHDRCHPRHELGACQAPGTGRFQACAERRDPSAGAQRLISEGDHDVLEPA